MVEREKGRFQPRGSWLNQPVRSFFYERRAPRSRLSELAKAARRARVERAPPRMCFIVFIYRTTNGDATMRGLLADAATNELGLRCRSAPLLVNWFANLALRGTFVPPAFTKILLTGRLSPILSG